MNADALTAIYDLDERQITQLHALYQHEWWTRGRSLDATRRCVEGSQVCVGLVDSAGTLLAFARVISDFIFKAVIFDVIVSSDARHGGLGKRLMELILGHDKFRQVSHIELYCLPELFPFYQQHGFSEAVGKLQLMRIVNT
jgi:predicted GNAT family N-acyltransferase